MQFAIDGTADHRLGHRDVRGRLRGQQQVRRRALRERRRTAWRRASSTCVTSTPGFTAAVYASDSVPSRISRLGQGQPRRVTVKREQVFQLDTAGRRFRNYLLWISELPEGGKVTIKELGLKK